MEICTSLISYDSIMVSDKTFLVLGKCLASQSGNCVILRDNKFLSVPCDLEKEFVCKTGSLNSLCCRHPSDPIIPIFLGLPYFFLYFS